MSAPDYRPGCNTVSTFILGATQAVCTNETSCNVVTFDPSLPDGGLGGAHVIDLDGLYTPLGPQRKRGVERDG